MSEPISRIEAALSQLGSEHEPPEGWERKVLAAAARPAVPEKSKFRWFWIGFPLAAVAVFLLVFRSGQAPVQLAWSVDGGSAVRGGGQAFVGQSLHVAAKGGGKFRALWVYRNDKLRLACPPVAPASECRGDEPAADLALSLGGKYRVFALSGKAELPKLTGDLDPDLAAAKRAELEIQELSLDVE